jgi:C4-dicarboxylate-specific signal transduction histidine kinase
LELNVSEIHYGGERLFIGFVRDLSERRRFEARLDKLHKNRLSTMAGLATGLAHELNQPLAAASTYLQAARRQFGAGPEQNSSSVDAALGAAVDQLQRAGGIIHRLRAFISRNEPDMIVQSLHAVIWEAYDLALADLKAANTEIVLHLDASDDFVLADRVQIQQVLVNLIRNAREAMINSDHRFLTISTEVKRDVVQTEVADTGHGLPDSINADLFEPFTTSTSGGMGVGLSISRSIIQAHHGQLLAQPNPGGGAIFTFTLPLASGVAVED